MKSPEHSGRWIIPAILLFGLALRGYHYLRCPSVWHDEAALLVNVIELNYQEQLGPLLWHEAAPPLFLWVERCLYHAFGDHVQLFRLLPFLASCGTLLLLLPISRRLLAPAVVPWAVLLFACGEKMAWHACEAKPYALDAFLAACLLYLFITGDQRSLRRQLLIFTLLALPLIFLSFPAVFLFGGLLVALLPAVYRERSTQTLVRYGVFGLVVVGSFLLLALGPAKAQRDGAMMSCWTGFFPDWSKPMQLPFWTAMATCEVFRYCFMPLGQLFVILAAMGGYRLWSDGRRSLLAFLVIPGGLALIAALLHRYPYGGARVMLYTAPALSILIAAGIPATMLWLRQRHRALAGCAIALLFLPAVQSLRRVVDPWERPETGSASEYVMQHRQGSDLVLGNNWTHVYYLRKLASMFHHFEGTEPQCEGAKRAWILYTSQVRDEERIKEARESVPEGWKVVEHQEFRFTTVLLAEDPDAQ